MQTGNHIGVFYDCSGSMKEYNKNILLKYFYHLIHETQDFYKEQFGDTIIKHFLWQNEIQDIDDIQENLFFPKGQVSLRTLKDFLKNNSSLNLTHIFILSDGFFDTKQSIHGVLSDTIKTLPISLATITNEDRLKKLTLQDICYAGEDIVPLMLNIAVGL